MGDSALVHEEPFGAVKCANKHLYDLGLAGAYPE